MTNTKKRIFSGILLTIFLFVISLGFFAIAFSKKEQGIAKADDVVSQGYTYVGSELFYLDMMVVSNGNNEPVSRVVVFDLTMTSDPSHNGAINMWTHSYFFDSFANNETPDSLSFGTWADTAIGTTPVITPVDNGVAKSRNKMIYGTNPAHWIPVYYQTEGKFNCDVVSVTLETVPTSSAIWTDWTYFLNGNTYKIIQLTYTDSSSNTFTLQFFTLSSVSLTRRTYYLANALNLDENQVYQQGYRDGVADNQQNVYNNGYSAGNTAGYATGFSAGVASANDYSFLGLFGAVIDAPISAFNGMFNFTILGVNLRLFILGLLSFAILLTILKWIKGGR